MSVSDEELMLRVSREQDERAFRELMSRYQRLLVNHFRRRGVYVEYEDLAQETFFKIYKARRRYKPTASFKTWMFTIAQRVWIDHLRKSGRRKTREEAYKDEPRVEKMEAASFHVQDADWALSQLSDAHRDVVVHAVYDQFSHQETAKILRIPEGTVKSRLHSALRNLREILEEEQP